MTAFANKNILGVDIVESKFTCLRLDDKPIFEKNSSIKNFLLFGCIDKPSGECEILVGRNQEG